MGQQIRPVETCPSDVFGPLPESVQIDFKEVYMDLFFLRGSDDGESPAQEFGKLAFTATHERSGGRHFLLPPWSTPLGNNRDLQFALNRFSHEFAKREFGCPNRIAREPQRFAEKIPTIQSVGVAFERPLKSDVAVDCGGSNHTCFSGAIEHTEQFYTMATPLDSARFAKAWLLRGAV